MSFQGANALMSLLQQEQIMPNFGLRDQRVLDRIEALIILALADGPRSPTELGELTGASSSSCCAKRTELARLGLVVTSKRKQFTPKYVRAFATSTLTDRGRMVAARLQNISSLLSEPERKMEDALVS